MVTYPNILFIVGLPGSGKSELAKKINKDNNMIYKIIDDPKDFNSDILPYINENLIITDPNLCFEKNRNGAISKLKDENPNLKIDWIYFENNPKQCLNNSFRRIKHKDVDSFIKNFSKFYTIPENSTILEVYV